jgi:Flp pilus assembly protein TadB
LRQRYLEDLAPWEQRLERLPAMQTLRRIVEQAGLDRPAHRLVFDGLTIGSARRRHGFALAPGCLVRARCRRCRFLVPFVRLWWLRSRRVQAIEEQLPDAIDVVKERSAQAIRSLRR